MKCQGHLFHFFPNWNKLWAEGVHWAGRQASWLGFARRMSSSRNAGMSFPHRPRAAFPSIRFSPLRMSRKIPRKSHLGATDFEEPHQSLGLFLLSRALMQGGRGILSPAPELPGEALVNTSLPNHSDNNNRAEDLPKSLEPAAHVAELTSSVLAFPTKSPASRLSTPSAGPRSGVPSVLNSEHDISSDERLTELTAELEDRRLARQKKLFEDMIVFEGGALCDRTSLDRQIIMRDFVQFALYHSKWGYYPKLFRKYRHLMTTGYFDPIPFASLRSQRDYQAYVAKIHESTPGFVTPTQLFQPIYGWVIAEYLVTTYRVKFDPREPLVVYDVGAGTGALALSVLDYLAEHFPTEYERCQYHVVEQNPYLIQSLRNKLIHHYHQVSIHHISILNWRVVERRRCIVLAIELLSGFPHDCILWDNEGTCSEHWFGFQQAGNLATAHERYYALKDPLILRYLRYLGWMQEETFHHLKVLCVTGGRETLDPPPFRSLEPNMEDPLHVIFSKVMWIHSPFRTAWLPTAQMLFLEVLAQYFPRHHLFVADWSSVRQGLSGFNAPVLQVKMRIAREMYLRQPIPSFHSNAGMVDMCFPTDFDHLKTVYRQICGVEKEVTSQSHPTFWRIYGGDKTSLFTTKTGFNPLLEDFIPFHVFASHHSPEL